MNGCTAGARQRPITIAQLEPSAKLSYIYRFRTQKVTDRFHLDKKLEEIILISKPYFHLLDKINKLSLLLYDE